MTDGRVTLDQVPVVLRVEDGPVDVLAGETLDRQLQVPVTRGPPIVLPAAELAIICLYGSLTDADLSYAVLGSYATAEWRTEIGWPIFRADGRAYRA